MALEINKKHDLIALIVLFLMASHNLLHQFQDQEMLQKDLHHLQQWKEDHCHEV